MDSSGLNTIEDGAVLDCIKYLLARVTAQTSQFTRDKDPAVSGNTGPVSPGRIRRREKMASAQLSWLGSRYTT